MQKQPEEKSLGQKSFLIHFVSLCNCLHFLNVPMSKFGAEIKSSRLQWLCLVTAILWAKIFVSVCVEYTDNDFSLGKKQKTVVSDCCDDHMNVLKIPF